MILAEIEEHDLLHLNSYLLRLLVKSLKFLEIGQKHLKNDSVCVIILMYV